MATECQCTVYQNDCIHSFVHSFYSLKKKLTNATSDKNEESLAEDKKIKT